MGAVSAHCHIEQILPQFVDEVMPSEQAVGLGLEQVLLSTHQY